VPSDSSFSILVKGTRRNIKSIAIKGNVVSLSLDSPVAGNEDVTVSYTVSNGNKLKTLTGVTIPSVPPQQITNNVTAQSQFAQDGIAVYPNPAAEFINISIPQQSTAKPKTVRIYDLSGKLHLESGIEPEATRARIPVSLTTGIYIVQLIEDKSTIFSKKILVRNQ
jgi:hypothetical protein